MSLPKVAVVVPTYQRPLALQDTLTALGALDYPEELLEIVVVDDGSGDSTRATVDGFRRVRYVRQANSGVAAARNRGARLSSGEILLFIDDDIVVAPDNVRRHVNVRAEHGECVVAGAAAFPPAVRADLVQTPFGRFRLWAEDHFQAVDLPTSGSWGLVEPLTVPTQNLSISRRLFWEIGGFDERFPVGAEDQDLCWRARAAGASILRDNRIRVVHNDQHRDLRALCAREERGAVGLVYLVRKHPDFPAPTTLDLNGPVRRDDSRRIVVRKIVRAGLTRPLPLAMGHQLVRGVEAVRPGGGWPLDYLYRALTGLYVFRGVRRGLRLTSGETWAVAHRAVEPVRLNR